MTRIRVMLTETIAFSGWVTKLKSEAALERVRKEWIITQLHSQENGVLPHSTFERMARCPIPHSREWRVAPFHIRENGTLPRSTSERMACCPIPHSREWRVTPFHVRQNGALPHSSGLLFFNLIISDIDNYLT